MKIARVRALEVLDSRGNPTVEAQVLLQDGTAANAQVPSGASTGRHEAHELRDGDSGRFGGRGVLRAVEHVDSILGPAVEGLNAGEQAQVDARLIETDGSQGKARLGANAVLAVSCAVARAAALSRKIPLWRHLAETAGTQPKLPVPMVNIISGGQHASGHPLEFQDFLVIPRGYPDLSAALEAVVQVHRQVFQALTKRGYTLTGVADEGGWGPALKANEQGALTLRQAIVDTGTKMDIAIDAASSQFFQAGRYQIEGQRLASTEMIDFLEPWIERYGVVSIEDGLAQDDWDGWIELTKRLGSRIALVGDDFFATNINRLEDGIERGAANSVLVKMNQIGTLTETFAVVRRATEAGYGAVISARSGETEDSFLADLAVASGAGQIKIGSIARSERLAKYNRLLQIEKWEL
jgi:enolase